MKFAYGNIFTTHVVCPVFVSRALILLLTYAVYLWSAVADLHSKILDVLPPVGVQILSVHVVLGKFLQNLYVGIPGVLAPPPRGNPGSTTGLCIVSIYTISANINCPHF